MTYPREHGTLRGAHQHRNHGEDLYACQPCAQAWRAYYRDRADRVRAAQAARRQSWANAERGSDGVS